MKEERERVKACINAPDNDDTLLVHDLVKKYEKADPDAASREDANTSMRSDRPLERLEDNADG